MVALRESAIRQAQQTRVVYTAQLPTGTSLEDALKPEFWINFAKRLRPCDQIELIPEDMSFFATVLVVDADSFGANVKVIHSIDLDADVIAQQSQTSEYDVRWGGPHDKFRVVRKSDNAVISKGHQNKTLAFQYVNNMRPKAA
jgi:hypothetical protein